MWLGGDAYSVTLELSDINFSLAPEDERSGLVESYAKFLNSHTSDIHVQVSILNRVLADDELRAMVEIGLRGDGLDGFRKEFNKLIRSKISRGRNNVVSERYVTLTTHADSFEDARIALARAVASDTGLLREVGKCEAVMLNGEARVGLLRSMLRPELKDRFRYTDLVGQKATTKDAVAPMAIGHEKNWLEIASGLATYYRQCLVLRNLPPWLSENVIKDLADIPIPLWITVHAQPIDQAEGLDQVKAQIAGMDMQIDAVHDKAANKGRSMVSIPHELQNAYDEATELRNQLEQSNEKLFDTTIVIGVPGENDADLKNNLDRVRAALAKNSCSPESLTYMQMDALNALLPLGINKIPVNRTLTTANMAILMPFTSQELLHQNGNFYGINALSGNLIVADRVREMNANGWTLGKSGSGKSWSVKFEIAQIRARFPNDEILIIDPEREYEQLVQALNGERAVISAGSPDSINPLDLDKSLNYVGDPVLDKAQFVLSICELVLGGTQGLSSQARSIIDRVTVGLLREYWANDSAVNPTLASLCDELLKQPEPEAGALATGLEIYSHGSFKNFSRPTSISRENKLLVYDLQDLPRSSHAFAVMVALEDVWARLQRNKARNVRTHIFVDEAHVLFGNDFTADYLKGFYQRVRKYGGSIISITQNIEELLASTKARLMLSNAATLMMFNQEATDARELQELLKLSEQQRSYMVNARKGCGLMKMGRVVIPFDNNMAKNSPLVQMFSTDFEADRG